MEGREGRGGVGIEGWRGEGMGRNREGREGREGGGGVALEATTFG